MGAQVRTPGVFQEALEFHPEAGSELGEVPLEAERRLLNIHLATAAWVEAVPEEPLVKPMVQLAETQPLEANPTLLTEI